jgi:hypothetical protein
MNLIARSRAGIDLDTEIVTLTALNSGPAGDLANATSSISIREANAIDILSAINNAPTANPVTDGHVRVFTGGREMKVRFVSAIGHFHAIVADLNTPIRDDDILVFGSITTGFNMSLNAGDDFIFGAGSDVESLNSFIFMKLDSGNADTFGATAIFLGDIKGNAGQTSIYVQGDSNDDTVSIQKLTLSPIAVAAEGGTLDNLFVDVGVGNVASERIDVFASLIDIDGQQPISYSNNEQLDLVTRGGDDKIIVQMPEPFHGTPLANVVRMTTGAGDDLLKIIGTTQNDTIRVNSYTGDANYRFQVRGDTGETECLQVFGFDGDDIIENAAPIASLLDGGNGNDAITGSDFAVQPATMQEVYDVIFGGAGADNRRDPLLNFDGTPAAIPADDARELRGLSGRGGNDFIYADHDFNFGSPVLTFADGDFVKGGTGRDIIIALGADTLRRDQRDFESDVVVGQGLNLTTNDFLFATFLPPNANNIASQLQLGLNKKCAMPFI